MTSDRQWIVPAPGMAQRSFLGFSFLLGNSTTMLISDSRRRNRGPLFITMFQLASFRGQWRYLSISIIRKHQKHLETVVISGMTQENKDSETWKYILCVYSYSESVTLFSAQSFTIKEGLSRRFGRERTRIQGSGSVLKLLHVLTRVLLCNGSADFVLQMKKRSSVSSLLSAVLREGHQLTSELRS